MYNCPQHRAEPLMLLLLASFSASVSSSFFAHGMQVEHASVRWELEETSFWNRLDLQAGTQPLADGSGSSRQCRVQWSAPECGPVVLHSNRCEKPGTYR